MREILFRGKMPVESKWTYGSLISEANVFDKRLVLTHIYDKDCNEILVDPETVGQYTGLTDKNGVKIFEGDVLEGDLDDNLDPGAKWRCTVVWGKFGWLCKARQTCPMDEFDIREGEVIGNIYDNPELIESQL